MATMHPAPQPSKSVFRLSHSQEHEEPVFYLRPFSNLPARRVLDNICKSGAAGQPAASPQVRALFLGCTDPRTIIKSLSEPAWGKGSQQLQLTAVLNDVYAPILARTALLLLMAAEIDPDNEADMQLLFDVWFNATWHPDTWPRFAAFVRKLVENSVPWLVPARPEDQQQLQEVWRWWLDEKHCNRPTVDKIIKDRASFNARNPTDGLYKFNSSISAYAANYPLIERLAKKVLAPAELEHIAFHEQEQELLQVQPRTAAAAAAAKDVLRAVKADISSHLQTGSLNWDGSSTQARGRNPCCSINITFVEPGTGAWNVHPDLRPFTCWGTYTAEDLKEVDVQSPGVLGRAFIARMANIMKGFQCNTCFCTSKGGTKQSHQVALQVQLMCGEALGLCLHDPFTSVLRKATNAQDSTSSSSGSNSEPTSLSSFTTFDIIDTGSLCDDVGLLPLLVAVTPRLSNHPAACLHTVPATWALGAPRMDYYLQEQALGMPLTMTPTLLGLRLVTDINWGRQTARTIYSMEENVVDPRELSWAPVPPSQPLPQLHLPCTPRHDGRTAWGPARSLAAVLQNVCKLCCTTDHSVPPHAYGDIPLNLSTPQTFAWLLASCISRVDMSSLLADRDQQPVPISTRQLQPATIHKILWALRTRVGAMLPKCFQLAFQGAIDSVRASLQAATGIAAVKAAGVPACNSQSFLLLSAPYWEHDERPSDVKLRRPYVRALLGADEHADLCPPRETEIMPGVKAMTVFMGNRLDFANSFAYHRSTWDGSKRSSSSRCSDKHSNIHVLDCCNMNRNLSGEWQASFMVPSEHATMHLSRKTTMMCLVGQDYFGIGIGPNKHEFLDVPVASVSPYLAHCLLGPLLLAGSVQSSKVAGAASLGPSLQVVSLHEDAVSYTAVLQLQGQGPASGLSVTLLQGAAATGARMDNKSTPSLCPSSHVVEVSLKQPAGVSAQLVLGWPVAAGLGEPEACPYDGISKEPVELTGGYSSGCGVTAKLKKSAGVVELTLTKAQVWERWPEDETQLKQAGPVAQHLKHQATQVSEMYMFTPAEASDIRAIEDKVQGLTEDNDRGNPEALLLRTLISLAATASLGRTKPIRISLGVAHNTQYDVVRKLHILLSPDWLVDADSQRTYIIPAVAIDMRLANALMCERQGKLGTPFSARENEASALYFQLAKLMEGHVLDKKEDPWDTVAFPAARKQDIDLVRRYLWHNAQQWQPDKWQRSVMAKLQPYTQQPVPCMLPYFATYICPLFVEHLQQFSYHEEIFAKMFPAGVPAPGHLLPLPYSDVTDIASAATSTAAQTSAGSSKSTGMQARYKTAATEAQHTSAGGPSGNTKIATSSSSADAQASEGRGFLSKAKASAFRFIFGSKDDSKCAAAPPAGAAPAAPHEQWVMEKLSQLRMVLPNTSDEELRRIAEQAYMAHNTEGTQAEAASSAAQAKADRAAVMPAAGDGATASGAPSQVTGNRKKNTKAAKAAAATAAITGTNAPCTAQAEEDEMKALLRQMYGDNVPELNTADSSVSCMDRPITQEYVPGQGSGHQTGHPGLRTSATASNASQPGGISASAAREQRTAAMQRKQQAQACASCGKQGKGLLACGRCKQACYCDASCQRAHWKTHKKECRA